MRRVLINNINDFFKQILQDKSLKEFAKENKISYSRIKRWARGEILIPEDVFIQLLSKSKNKDFWLKNIKYKSENWGQIKGGLKSVSSLSKDSLNKKLQKARKNIKKQSPKELKLNINESFCEFYGALMGDGCLSRFKRSDCNAYRYAIIITGDKNLDKDYHENYLSNIIKNEFKIKPYIYLVPNINTRKLILYNTQLFLALEKISFPVGEKGKRLKIPDSLMSLDWDFQKLVLRGLFDTDGSIYARKDEGYKYLHVTISSISEDLINQIASLLKEHNYPHWIDKNKENIRIKGNKNVIRWMNDIGSSNNRHIFKYNYWLKHNTLPAYLRGPIV